MKQIKNKLPFMTKIICDTEGASRYSVMKESHAIAFRELCEMAKDMAVDPSMVTNTQLFAHKLWKEIFENGK